MSPPLEAEPFEPYAVWRPNALGGWTLVRTYQSRTLARLHARLISGRVWALDRTATPEDET